MAKETTLFEESVAGSGGISVVYGVKLSVETDDEISLNAFRLMSLSIEESIGPGTFTVNMIVKDGFGDLTNGSILLGKYVFTLTLRDEAYNVITYKMKLANINVVSGEGNPLENGTVQLTFISHLWENFIHKKHTRSWKNKTYSEVVKELAEESGFKCHTEDTGEKIPLIVQPNWSNFQMLKYIKDRCGKAGSDFAGFFEIIIVSDGLLFATFPYLKKTLDVVNSNYPRGQLYFRQYQQDQFQTTQDRDAYFDAPTRDYYYTSLQVKNNHFVPLLEGASGITYFKYDYRNKGNLKRRTKKFSDFNESMAVDTTLIDVEREVANTYKTFGRNERADQITSNHVSGAVNDMVEVVVTIEGLCKAQPGEPIFLVIPSAQDQLLNYPYGGYYFVKSKKTDFSMSSSPKTTFTMFRQGVNIKDRPDLVK